MGEDQVVCDNVGFSRGVSDRAISNIVRTSTGAMVPVPTLFGFGEGYYPWGEDVPPHQIQGRHWRWPHARSHQILELRASIPSEPQVCWESVICFPGHVAGYSTIVWLAIKGKLSTSDRPWMDWFMFLSAHIRGLLVLGVVEVRSERNTMTGVCACKVVVSTQVCFSLDDVRVVMLVDFKVKVEWGNHVKSLGLPKAALNPICPEVGRWFTGAAHCYYFRGVLDVAILFA
ncbi:hypothetical protein Acr_08g0005380 [Actinidia rufa]|uniref:Uncharacterized protein n=1 Tax=Actinidia rufa TaxID=165716 RepID=A0A7J0F0E1_9ERIC|nr:hypothetical protein Acr_08g0005380 [Actinidia rufa]